MDEDAAEEDQEEGVTVPTKTKTKPLSWEPVLVGNYYCAPACGGRCTKEEFDQATQAAQELCRNLGPGWRPRVQENLGWHYAAISKCGRWKVHAHPATFGISYTAFLSADKSEGGQWAETAKTPKAAIAKTWKIARPTIELYAELLTARPT